MKTEFELKNIQMAYFKPQYFYSFKKEIFKLFCVSFRWVLSRFFNIFFDILII